MLGALLTLAACGGSDRGVISAKQRALADQSVECERRAGYFDYTAIPASVDELVEMADAALVVEIVGEERLASRASSDFSTWYVMSSDATVDEVIKGESKPGDTIAVSRMIVGPTIEQALRASACTIGGQPELAVGTRYLVGLSRDQRGWFPTSGPHSVVPFGGTGGEAIVDVACPPIPGASCDEFPYDLVGAAYRNVMQDARS